MVTIIDQNTLQPIENVGVYIGNSESKIALTNASGQLMLNKLSGSELLVFRNLMYSPVTTTLDKLKESNLQLTMSENVNSINEIVVSASKFEEKRKDISQKIQVIRATEIQNMNQTSTADVIANSGNIMVQKSQLGGGSPIIRGFETNKVLMVVDGIRMNNAIYRGGHLQNIISLDNSIMDRVEIVFGPGSVVYGSDALGGVMSFTTKNPTLSSTDKIKVKVGQYMRYTSAVSGYATHGDISLANKRFGSLTSITASDFGDLRQGANRELSVGNFGSRPWYVERVGNEDVIFKNKDTNLQVGSGYTQYDVLQKFLFQQNQNIKHIINFHYSTSSDIPRYDRLVLLSAGMPKYAEWNYGPQNRLMGSYALQLSSNTKFYDNARFIFGYQKIQESRIDRKFNDASRNTRIEDLDILTANIDFAQKIGKHEFRYGLEGWFNAVLSSAFSKNINTGIETPLDTRYASGGSSMKSVATYLTHTWEISDKFILNDGIRFSDVSLDAKFTDTTFFNFPFNDVSQHNQALTGNVGVVFMPNEDCRLTALVSSGFRAPNVDDLSKIFESIPGTINVPNSNLKPEYTYNGEIGVSNRFGNLLTAQATGYYALYRNALTTQNFTYNGQDSIMYAGTMSQVVATTNANKAYLYGLELSVNGRLNDNVSIYGTYNYTYARIVNDSSVAIPLGHIPPVFGKFGFQINEKKIRSDFFVNYSAAKKIADYSPSGEDNQLYALPTGMPSWYTVNAKITYQFNKLIGLQIACENILDKNYRVFSSNISSPGRNIIATLRWNF